MGKKIFYAHAGSGNHGCEAIVRSSAQILGNDLVLYSMNAEQDYKYGVQKEISLIKEDKDIQTKRYSKEWIASRLQTKLTKSIDREIYNRKKDMFDTVQMDDIAFSIGGDNYCYSGTEILGAQNSLLRKKGAKTILWGCSVEPELIHNESISKDLSKYNLIVARESISYEALKKVNPNTILVPDPAFVLEKEELPLPDEWIEGNMIGINVSPLILQSASNGVLVFDAYRELIHEILNSTDCGIALIPHVVWENNDDRVPLKQLYDEFKESGRVAMIDDHNCMELKGYIARCRMFIGARTHATIAAYSSCVPTLVLGYSVKSRGIAKDLFGTEENFVISVQNIDEQNALAKQFRWMLEREIEIREHLNNVIPEYSRKIELAKMAVSSM